MGSKDLHPQLLEFSELFRTPKKSHLVLLLEEKKNVVNAAFSSQLEVFQDATLPVCLFDLENRIVGGASLKYQSFRGKAKKRV